MDDEGDDVETDGFGASCSLTNLLQPFAIISIQRITNDWTAIKFQSCPLFRYIVLSADVMRSNAVWQAQAYTSYVWGQPNATTWTDTTTSATVTQRFYKVERILGNPIAAGEYHSLALTPDGTLWAWGGNSGGELGDGTTANRLVPTALSSNLCGRAPISNVVAVAGGHQFSVAADANGRVWTWGDNSSLGVLGDGTNYGQTSSPVPIAGASNVVAVAAGWKHTLALRGDGTVWAWGSDSIDDGSQVAGQLGVGDPALYATNTPVQSLVATQVVAIAGGLFHSAAVRADGTVWTWGLGGEGQLGNGGTDSTNIPVQISGISNVVSIAAGDLHTVALTADRKVWTWGNNDSGQLGDGTVDTKYTPVQVTALTNQNVVAIAAGNAYTLAVTTNGQLFAWGDNSYGQLGTNVAAVPSTNAPMRVPGISNVVMVAAGDGSDGGGQTLAVTVDHGTNQYWAWGRDDFGQVGNGTNGSGVIQSSPQQLVFPCVQYIQLGTGGTFQAQCTGTLTLYFNDDQHAYGDNGTNSYNVTVTGLANNVAVLGNASNGVAIGTVTNGEIYIYSASGFCSRGNGQLTNPDGRDENEVLVGCATGGTDPSSTPCPCGICYSLVGKVTQ